MPQHIARLISILLVALILAVTGANYFTDSSFYRFGHYRADAVPMLASGSPQYQGSASCHACHESASLTWKEEKHVVVQCEVCHGAAANHPNDKKLTIPADTIQLCSLCHEAMPARPMTQPQIVINQHPYEHEQPLPCTSCHNPHAPGLGSDPEQSIPVATPVQQTPVLVSQCSSCHGAAGQGVGEMPALAGKEFDFLETQLRQFRSGDIQGVLMNTVAASLSDEQILQLAQYYAGLPHSGAEK